MDDDQLVVKVRSVVWSIGCHLPAISPDKAQEGVACVVELLHRRGITLNKSQSGMKVRHAQEIATTMKDFQHRLCHARPDDETLREIHDTLLAIYTCDIEYPPQH
jgi:hypothetical protein